MDQKEFLEVLHDVQDLVTISGDEMSKEDILGQFEELNLTEEQKALVLDYIEKQKNAKAEDTRNTEGVSDENSDVAVQELKSSTEEQKEAEEAFLNSTFVKMYMDDIKTIKKLSKEELADQIDAVLSGDEEMVDVVINQYLDQVIEIAKRYVLLKVRMEDVIQEGNMALVLAVSALCGNEVEDADAYIKQQIQSSMEIFIDAQLDDENWENVVLGRANLLRAAQENLAKELVRTPTTQELSEYTKLSEAEIADLLALVKEKEN